MLKPLSFVEKVHAVVFTGGSVFGLDAAGGVIRYLEERNIGYDVGLRRIPIVCAAALYDLEIGDPLATPKREDGYTACLSANSNKVKEGSVGAGTGATIGKLFGPEYARKGGQGSICITSKNGVKVGVLVVVNSVGNIYHFRTGRAIAGAFSSKKGDVLSFQDFFKNRIASSNKLVKNTTLGVVATNCRFNKQEVNKLADMAHNGVSHVIRPAHTTHDGDIFIAIATGEVSGNINRVGMLAEWVVAKSICRAVMRSKSVTKDALGYHKIGFEKIFRGKTS